MLTVEALARIEAAIGRKFPYTDYRYRRIYQGTTGNRYNFEQLRLHLQLVCDANFSMSRDTLQRILCRTQGVDANSIRGLFKVLAEPVENTDYTRQQENEAQREAASQRTSQRLDRHRLNREFCNLPEHTQFVGRDAELRNLLKYISPEYRGHIITIDGVGGVGKTTLVVEAAYLCWESKQGHPVLDAPIYDAIIFKTFKDTYLLPDAVVSNSRQRKKALSEIFRTIAETLDDQAITRAEQDDQWQHVYASLRRQRTLLIIDDLQALDLEEQNEVIAFLSDLPFGTKAVITTRKRRLGFSAIRLDCLSEEESLRLIQQQVTSKGMTPIDDEIAKRLHYCFWGIPVALVYAIGKLASGYPIEGLIGESCQRDKEASHFCFASSVEPLRGKASHAVLMALSIFHVAPGREALSTVAGLHKEPRSLVDDGLAELYRLSLMEEKTGRYAILSVTREYTLAELSHFPTIEREMRERWVNWYISFAQQYGGRDWGDWYTHYDLLQAEWENILAVLNWCSALERYEAVKQIWNHVNHFADLYGYWQDRLTWLEWLINKSAAHGEWGTYVSTLSKKAWTLTMIGNIKTLKEAERLFIRAWRYHTHADLETLDYLAHNQAIFYIRQRRYEEARRLLDEKEQRLTQVQPGDIEDRLLVRLHLNTLRDRAKIFYEEGNGSQAKRLYQQAVTQAEQIHWSRGVCYIRNMLANIAIQQQRWEEAELHLNIGMPIVRRNNNRRRLACYKRSWANLEQQRGKTKDAYSWAHKAMEGFIRLGMTREAEEMAALLEIMQ
jgi:LuxR family glucitol operon transcriptional activator